MNKISIILGVLLILAIGAAGYFWLQTQKVPGQALGPYTLTASESPTPVPTTQVETANWKTYSSSKFGFSLEYPPDWEYLEIPNEIYDPGYQGIWFTPKDKSFPKPNTGGWIPMLMKFTQATSPNAWLSQYPSNYFGNQTSSNFTAGVLKGTQISGSDRITDQKKSVVITSFNGWDMAAAFEPELVSEQTFTQILATIKNDNN